MEIYRKMCEPKVLLVNAPVENRTRVTSLATKYSTTEPQALKILGILSFKNLIN